MAYSILKRLDYTQSMFYSLGTYLIRGLAWLDLALLSCLVYGLSFLPAHWTACWYSPLFRTWCWAFIHALGVRLKVHQHYHENLPSQWIVIANHPSAFEDIGMPALFKARFLAKRELKDWWVLGRISLFARTLYVKRDCKDSRKQATAQMIEALQQGDNIGIYPEGGCKGRRIVLPFQYGIFEIAIQTGVKILPVFMHYEAQADFEWSNGESLIQTLWKMMRASNKTVNYHVFNPLDPKAFKTKEELCTYTENLYLQWQQKYLD